jgi:hypothetical protein
VVVDFSGNTPNQGGPISSTTLGNAYAVSLDSTGVYIADQGNNRVLFYPDSSTTAVRVYGALFLY